MVAQDWLCYVVEAPREGTNGRNWKEKKGNEKGQKKGGNKIEQNKEIFLKKDTIYFVDVHSFGCFYLSCCFVDETFKI